MKQAALALAVALALPQLSPLYWPLLLAALYLTRPVLAQLTLVVLLLLQAPQALPILKGWWERCQARVTSAVGVYPDHLAGDRPQTLTVYAPHSQSLRAHWQGNQLPLPCESLGRGVFRVLVQPAQARPGAALQLDSDGDGRGLAPLSRSTAPVRPGPISSLPEAGVGAAVSESSDEILLASRDGKLQRYPCGDGPSCCQFLPDGRHLLIGTKYNQDLEIMDLPGGRIRARIPLQGPVESMTLSADGLWLAILSGRSVQIRSLPELKVQAQIDLPAAGEFLTFAGNRVVVSSRQARCLFRIDRTPAWTLHDPPLLLARPALGLSPGADVNEVWIASTSGQLHGSHQKGNHYVLNCLLQLDVQEWVLRNSVSTELRTGLQEGPGAINSGCGPEGLQLDSRGRLLVAYSGTHEVASRDLQSGVERRHSLASQGLLAPRWLADLGEETWLVSLPAQHSLAWVKQGQVEHLANLGATELVDEGEINFYEATQSGVSCQSCHTRGDSDYARHDIGGFEAWGTLSCEGIQNTPPYLRNGSYPRLQDLHVVSTGLYRNYARTSKVDRADSLREYLNSLWLPDNPHPADLAQRQRGCQLFFQCGCADCHTPPRFTNLASLPNENLFPGQPGYEWLDVPSLHGVWRSAPYLHDGRAADLQDVLEEENQANRHGASAALNHQQKLDLEAFLRCL